MPITNHCQMAAPAQQRCVAAAKKHQHRQHRHNCARAQSQHEPRVILLPHDQAAPRINEKPATNSGMIVTPSGFAEKRIKPKPAEHGHQRHRHQVWTQAGINHHAGSRSICAPSRSRGPRPGRFQEHRHESRHQDHDGFQPVHCISTQTSSRVPGSAHSFTRTSGISRFRRACDSPRSGRCGCLRENVPMPLVTTAWPGFNIATCREDNST